MTATPDVCQANHNEAEETNVDASNDPSQPTLTASNENRISSLNPISDDPISTSVTNKARVWSAPWVVMLTALYVFAVPWVINAILFRYFLKPQWGAALPGLDSTPLRKLTMRGHVGAGAISLLIGPFQFIPWLRRRSPSLHRWSGRIYCTCAMLSSLFGLSFIALKGQLVGGLNMSVAFASSGIAIGILAFKVWETARAAKASLVKVDYTSHRDWAIRSYSQILAPLLYRYWYIFMLLFKVYDPPDMYSMGLVCRADGVCPAYLRIVDQLHCWTYWLSSLAIAELVIYFLPSVEPKPPLTSTLSMSACSDGSGAPSLCDADGGSSGEATAGTPLLASSNAGERSDGVLMTSVVDEGISRASPTTVNVIGWTLAFVTVANTTKLLLYKP